MHRVALAVLVLMLLAPACGGLAPGPAPGDACTTIGCVDGLTVRVTPGAPWPAGAYRFVVDAGGVTVTCAGVLPLRDCASRAITCDREGVVSIVESGCALPPDQHGFGDVSLPTTPAAITIEVQHEGRTIGRQTFAPEYRTVQPNGPGCEPTCTNASVDLALAFD